MNAERPRGQPLRRVLRFEPARRFGACFRLAALPDTRGEVQPLRATFCVGYLRVRGHIQLVDERLEVGPNRRGALELRSADVALATARSTNSDTGGFSVLARGFHVRIESREGNAYVLRHNTKTVGSARRASRVGRVYDLRVPRDLPPHLTLFLAWLVAADQMRRLRAAIRGLTPLG